MEKQFANSFSRFNLVHEKCENKFAMEKKICIKYVGKQLVKLEAGGNGMDLVED